MHRTCRLTIALVCGSALGGMVASAQAYTYKVLYSFQGGSDGAYPNSLISINGTLYGTSWGTSLGNGGNYGTVFSLNPVTGVETVVYSFKGGSDGAGPNSLININGTFYGTTVIGGSKRRGGSENGTVFSLNPATGAEKVVCSFKGGALGDGAYPAAGLIDVDGILYGTTFKGGSRNCNSGHGNCGTVFSLNPTTGAYNLVYSFKGSSDADNPSANSSLVNVDGTLYGVSYYGGGSTTYCSESKHGCGTIFSLNPTTGAEKILYSFKGRAIGDGAFPVGLINVGSALYGTTNSGSFKNCLGRDDGCGTIYSVNLTTGIETVVYSFIKGGNHGAFPFTGPINVGGTLYGVTGFGGSTKCPNEGDGCGTVFSLNPATGAEQVVYSFSGGSNGAIPNSLISVGGALYGTTQMEYSYDYGTVFALTP